MVIHKKTYCAPIFVMSVNISNINILPLDQCLYAPPNVCVRAGSGGFLLPNVCIFPIVLLHGKIPESPRDQSVIKGNDQIYETAKGITPPVGMSMCLALAIYDWTI